MLPDSSPRYIVEACRSRELLGDICHAERTTIITTGRRGPTVHSSVRREPNAGDKDPVFDEQGSTATG
jgi:hypothetical protein